MCLCSFPLNKLRGRIGNPNIVLRYMDIKILTDENTVPTSQGKDMVILTISDLCGESPYILKESCTSIFLSILLFFLFYLILFI